MNVRKSRWRQLGAPRAVFLTTTTKKKNQPVKFDMKKLTTIRDKSDFFVMWGSIGLFSQSEAWEQQERTIRNFRPLLYTQLPHISKQSFMLFPPQDEYYSLLAKTV